MRKKSYMDIDNILNEGIIDSLLKVVKLDKISRIKRKLNRLDNKKKKLVQKSKLPQSIDKLNQSTREVEKNFEKAFGIKPDSLGNMTLEDFLDKEIADAFKLK